MHNIYYFVCVHIFIFTLQLHLLHFIALWNYLNLLKTMLLDYFLYLITLAFHKNLKLSCIVIKNFRLKNSKSEHKV